MATTAIATTVPTTLSLAVLGPHEEDALDVRSPVLDDRATERGFCGSPLLPHDLVDHNSAASPPLSTPQRATATGDECDFEDQAACSCASYRTTPGLGSIVDMAKPFAGVTVAFIRPSSTARISIYRRLQSLGLRIIMVSREHRPLYDAGVDRWAICEPNDTVSITAALKIAVAEETAAGYPCRGALPVIATFDEYGIFPAAKLNEAASRRPMPFSSDFIDLNNVKSRFRDWCLLNGVNAPRYCATRATTDDVLDIMAKANVHLPVVVKPCPGAGSSYVRMCRTVEEIAEAIPQLWAGIERMAKNDVYFAGGLSEAPHLLVEEFIGGQEVDIDCVVEDGNIRFAGISDNFETTPPWFSEQGGVAPSQLPQDAQHCLLQLLQAYLSAAKKQGERCHGVLHFEAKYDFERRAAYVIEVNCRLGGAETETMVRTAFGVDLGEAHMRLALGLPLQPMPAPFQTTGVVAASVNVYPEHAGHLDTIIEPAAESDGLVVSVPYPTTRGALIGPAPVSFGCFLWAVAKGATAEEAMKNIRSITRQCKIVVSETPLQ